MIVQLVCPSVAGAVEDDVSQVEAPLPEWDKAINRVLGEELRRAREARGWSRMQLVEHLPSRIGDRTLLSYEHGLRRMTVVRFIEICLVMGADPIALQQQALQRARVHLANLTLRIDLRVLVNDHSVTYRPMEQWARNALNEHPDGIVELPPAVVRNLALFVGCGYRDLAKYLARFTPDE